MPSSRQAPLVGLFEPLPLPRSRAYLSLTFGALALLLIGGVLSYASDSPDLRGGGANGPYWSLFFSFHALAFGGAALLGAFPRLCRPAVKLAWSFLVVGLAGLALMIRLRGSVGPPTVDWSLALRPYLPALIPLAAGVFWGSYSESRQDSLQKEISRKGAKTRSPEESEDSPSSQLKQS